MLVCSICGSTGFTPQKVLWPELIAAWQLTAEEAAYINDQQGCTCDSCGSNLRMVALGTALRDAWSTALTIRSYVSQIEARRVRILDLNGAGPLSDALAELPNYVRADFPQVDMQALPYANDSFDIVMHSDTLEHIERPILALEECKRVLVQNGRLCMTIPIIVGRMSRSRAGLAKSHHGDPKTTGDDFIVHTEFGADAWTYLARAGFTRIMLNHVQFPAGVAISAWA